MKRIKRFRNFKNKKKTVLKRISDGNYTWNPVSNGPEKLGGTSVPFKNIDIS